MEKLNCWEFKGCGRAPGGDNAAESGVCPTSLEKRLNGIHGGTNAGRACWVIAGTTCDGAVQGTFAQKYRNCFICDFHLKVSQEEGPDRMETSSLLLALGA